jgi:hypothetical protein
MEGDTAERGTAWLGYALQEGIKHGLTDAREILAHATPEVLVAQLPRDLTTLLIAGSLKTGRLTPESVMEVAPPMIMAEHLEANILWSCLSDAAEAANLVAAGGSASSAGRRWMGDILGRAITDGPPAEWVKDAPPQVVSEMLAAGLAKGSFDAKLALSHLTPELLAEHLSPPLVWKCIAEAVAKNFHLGDVDANASDTLARAAASMSASKLEAMVVRQSPMMQSSPIITRKLPDSDSWEAASLSDDAVEEEVIEETDAGQLPPAPPKKKAAASPSR